MLIKIKDLKLRVVVGFKEWERAKPQDVVFNICMEVDDEAAAKTDDVADSVDYKALKQRIIDHVADSSYFLVERLASACLDIIMEEAKVSRATVEVDKPHALRFAESVSVVLSRERG